MEVLDHYEFDNRGTPGSRYDSLLDGKVYRVSLEDFPDCNTLNSLRGAIKVTGSRRGLKVITETDKTTDPPSIILQASRPITDQSD